MKYTEFLLFTGSISSEHGVKGEKFRSVILKMISMLDETDFEDFFGTEGWRHYFGWDE